MLNIHSLLWLIWGVIGVVSVVLVWLGVVMAGRRVWASWGTVGRAKTHEVDYVITYDDLTWLDGECAYEECCGIAKKRGGVKMACKGKKKKGKK